MAKANAEMKRNTMGAMSSHTAAQRGRRKAGGAIEDLRQVIPNRLLIAEATLNTNDSSQKRLTELSKAVDDCEKDNWSVVAVTPEKKVAIVVMFKYLEVALFSALRMGGRAENAIHECNVERIWWLSVTERYKSL